MQPLPPCTSDGLINLCNPAPVYTFGIPWFQIQLPNLIWFGLVVILIIIALLLPFPGREIDFLGYQRPGEENEP